jgi:alpha-L-fucosidase
MSLTKDTSIPKPSSRIERFEKLAFGLFIHWGLYSQIGQGEWIMHRREISVKEYEKLKDNFTAKDFDAAAIVRLTKEAGMKYITLTCRHHEGFSLYDTRGLSDFDAVHSPAGRDLIAEFVGACRADGILPVLYHTTLDWHWGYTQGCDPASRDIARFNQYLDYLYASVEVLCKNYGPVGGLWFDGNWSQPDLDWKLDRLYGMIRDNQPEALIINNTGIGSEGKISHPMIDSVTFEQSMAKPLDRRGHEKYITGEMNQTMNAHWGVGANDLNYKPIPQFIETLAKSRKVGANYLLNIGPTATGAIPELEAAMLRKIGRWVRLHADAIYQGRPVDAECTGDDFILEANGKWYYFVFNLGIAGHRNVTVATGGIGPRIIANIHRHIKKVKWMDNGESLAFTQNLEKGFGAIELTGYPYGTHLVVRVAEIEF